jgi:oxygen-independent coproporphyrinogen-3 oxidase
LEYLYIQSQKFLDDKLLSIENNVLKATKKGKFLTDGIASDLFFLN